MKEKNGVQHDADASLQLRIEKIQISKLENELNITGLGNDSYLYLNGDPSAKIKPDIYLAEHRIIGEVYTHLGKLKPAQMRKVTSDIFKMVLFEKDSGVEHEKYYVICDKDVEDSMYGNAVIRTALYDFKIQIKCFELEEPLLSELKETMKKQDLTR